MPRKLHKMAMSHKNDVSHLLVKPLWNGFSARVLVHTTVWPRLEPGASCLGNCKSSILGCFSQDGARTRHCPAFLLKVEFRGLRFMGLLSDAFARRRAGSSPALARCVRRCGSRGSDSSSAASVGTSLPPGWWCAVGVASAREKRRTPIHAATPFETSRPSPARPSANGRRNAAPNGAPAVHSLLPKSTRTPAEISAAETTANPE